MTMNMVQVFHMNKGGGETSYAKNCTIQSKILSITKPFVEAAMHDYISTGISWDTITIAELGCSSGPTALDAVTTIMDVVESRQKVAKFMVYLVDLPTNDFNEVFSFIPSLQKKVMEERSVGFGPCFIAGLPGNFYERLLPNHSLHFVHSSSSLHWLSQGLLEEEKVDSLNVPFYAPSLQEVKQLIEEESSFDGDHFAAIEVEWDAGSGIKEEFHSYKRRVTRGEIISKMHRAVLESMLEHHFGGDVMDELFLRYAKIWDAHLLFDENSKLTVLVISLIRM
ncbi:hypothetical protein KSS87_022994 [Heliosperma pusillum]|nr:hypothetical protein KSS87_022994 [Heliosperma pusillum]